MNKYKERQKKTKESLLKIIELSKEITEGARTQTTISLGRNEGEIYSGISPYCSRTQDGFTAEVIDELGDRYEIHVYKRSKKE